MENKTKRPVVIWLSLLFLVVLVLYNLQLLYFKWDVLLHTARPFLVLDLLFTWLMIYTFIAIKDRSKWGQRLAILCFALTGIFGINNAVILFNWPADASQNGLLLGRVVVVSRIMISFFLAFAIGATQSAITYFAEQSEPSTGEPPPSFDA